MLPLCEACELNPAEMAEPCFEPGEEFRVCKECHNRLVNFALRPLEWYNLAKRHSWQQYLLHDDFYDETGEAGNPHIPIDSADDFPLPSFSEVCLDSNKLLDWCIARWRLGDREYSAWRSIAVEHRFKVFGARYESTSNIGVRGVVLELIAHTGDRELAELVRKAWRQSDVVSLLFGIVDASAATLPFEEAYSLATSVLSDLDENNRRNALSCLGYFRNQSCLDWIETNFFEPVADSWGYLAALSCPSWTRIEKWLNSGRPLSLIAIDALLSIADPKTRQLQRYELSLMDAPRREEFEATLTNYALIDPSPRVAFRVKKLIQEAHLLSIV